MIIFRSHYFRSRQRLPRARWLCATNRRRFLLHMPVSMAVLGFIFFAPARASADHDRLLTETRDPEHVAVMGGGYLLAEDSEGKCYLITSCVLIENEYSQLCTRVGDKRIVLQPAISIPYSTDKLFFSPSGGVSVIERGETKTAQEIGKLTVAIVRQKNDLHQVAPGIFEYGDSIKPLVMGFGDQSGAFLFQGWIEPAILAAHVDAIASCPTKNHPRCAPFFGGWFRLRSRW